MTSLQEFPRGLLICKKQFRVTTFVFLQIAVTFPKMTEIPKIRRQIAVLRILVVTLFIALLALAIAFAVHTGNLQEEIENRPITYCQRGDNNIKLDPPDYLPPFHDLTDNEITNVKDYLYSDTDLNLVNASAIWCNLSYIYTIELYIPNKDLMLGYLDHGRAQPEREAKVILFRGDKPESYVEEYVVGPLPQPTYKKDQKTYPFRYRPITTPEHIGAIHRLKQEVHEKVGKLLEESYGGKLLDCKENCLEFKTISMMSPVVSGEPVSRKIWFWLAPDVEYFSLHPLDFSVLVDVTSKYVEQYTIQMIYYGEERFMSLHELMQAYKDGSVVKTKIPFPSKTEHKFSSSKRKVDSENFNDDLLPPPREFEPAGKRYSINGRHITYLQWDLDLRMSTISGPQLFNVKYQNERIVYELSLQEISVFYSGNGPGLRYADFIDSIALLGGEVRSLIPGSDCPVHSTYIPTSHVFEYSEEPVTIERAFCVFEHNTARPLRRHLERHGKNKFYGGMEDSVLTIRSIITIHNYDYIIDFSFHQNGAIHVSVLSTGYILTSYRYPAEDDYGFRLRDHMTGNIHHHMFNFKVDLDIKDRYNRFETLEIVPTAVDNSLWSANPNIKYHQTKFYRNHIHTEKEAAIKYNFSSPNYLTFYSNKHKSKYGVPRAYRLLNRGMSKQVRKWRNS